MTEGAKPGRILVVDDDEGMLLLMAETLRADGFEVETASSGAAALARLRHGTPDLMLLDLKMQEVDGSTLVQRLKRHHPPVPFLIVTGQGDEKVAVEVMKQGALDYVMKDTGLLDLLPGVVRRAIEAIERERALASTEREILRISDREQRRIGQDLHDGLGQQLTAIEFMCQSLKSDLAESNPQLVDQVSLMGRFLREAVTQTRALAHGLTAFMLDASGLQVALAELAERTSQLGRVKCRFECAEPVVLQDSETAAQLYRIAQEAVSNALRHAEAAGIVLGLSSTGGEIVLRVSDDGKGLPAAGRRRRATGIGLQVMRHRANSIGAELTVESKRGKGVTVTCTLRSNP
ncbi:MAG: response regulator [Opitutus sp.]